jgi:hypothetical protein
MNTLAELAGLIAQRNAVERAISQVIGCPAHSGHIGEYIAAVIFNITLNAGANHKQDDGRFSTGPLQDQTVNIKYMSRKIGILNMGTSRVAVNHPDWYLVLTGPTSKPMSTKQTATPWVIEQVFLFNSQELLRQLNGKRTGIATGVPKVLWQAAKLYPEAVSPHYTITEEQRAHLNLFRSASSAD